MNDMTRSHGGTLLDPAPGRTGKTTTSNRLAPGKLPRGLQLAGPVLLVVLWEAAARLGYLSPHTLAAPSTAIATGFEMFADGTLLPHLAASAGRAYAGLFLGVLAGVVLALASGLTMTGEALIDGLVQIKRAIPTLALIPLVILWLGIGEAMKIFIIFTAVLVPVYVNTHAALRGIDIGHVELARTLGLTRSEFIRNVALPGALPGFFVSLRLAVTLCWTSLVVLELINTQTGIGYLMNRARDWGQTDIIVVGILIYAVLGLLSDAAVRMVEARALSYRRSIGS
ncbi:MULTISPECIES: ABC transporter permease [Paracoccus]|jgi:sulfonate transport system permease protein|uniref:Binding-protein-dependent transport systems inner membrane component n=1 Tax=Paracoccus denitrificans (strain Pd 1222) TaxID=318586 RepID=A1B9I0_PARDP|nr:MULTISPECIES: ABC transporter permease [Paracoccus]ABL72174.1 binding-protein-dependent transport systems inner membrane component [Paracoccus denitrificans PD1222]MBB4625909.1 sulfonate transport system permease protein [Paracoccus denitrificans]MCU7426928.1 ABC transporter permease [Paracoccus denitrificans]MDK8871865.1 ABC transporter permease [Paracoccus sp. SSJ]QAR28748.1 ABC transporter permease [Paracoccus denitrificans]